MTTTTRQKNGVGVLDVNGSVDATTAPQLEAAIDALLPEVHYRLVVNLTGVGFLGSNGLRVLITSLKKARAEEGDLKVYGMNENIQKLFKLSGFKDLFDLVASEAEAIEHFGA